MTNFDKELFIEWGKAVASVCIAFVMLLLACFICGCTETRHVPVREYHTESIKTDSTMFLSLLQTLRNIELSRQSNSDTTIIIHNEQVTLNEQGDTIGKTSNTSTYKSTSKESEYLRTIEILRDSVRELKAQNAIVRVDSVPVPYPVEKIREVERPLAWWQTGLMWVGGLALVLLGWLVYRKASQRL